MRRAKKKKKERGEKAVHEPQDKRGNSRNID
jgi:hypothetical protein